MTFTNFNSYFILAWDSKAHIGEDTWCTWVIYVGIFYATRKVFILLKKGKQITTEWRMERRFIVLKKGKQITTEWMMERRFFYFSKKRGWPRIWKGSKNRERRTAHEGEEKKKKLLDPKRRYVWEREDAWEVSHYLPRARRLKRHHTSISAGSPYILFCHSLINRSMSFSVAVVLPSQYLITSLHNTTKGL